MSRSEGSEGASEPIFGPLDRANEAYLTEKTRRKTWSPLRTHWKKLKIFEKKTIFSSIKTQKNFKKVQKKRLFNDFSARRELTWKEEEI